MSKMLERPTRVLLTAIYNHPYLTLFLSVCLTVFSGWGATHLKLKTKVQDLLPQNAPSVQASRSLSERLGSVDILVATLMTSDFDKVKSVLPQLSKTLKGLEGIREVRWRQDISLIQKNALITFPTLQEIKDAYQDLTDEIKKAVKSQMSLFDDEESDEEAKEAKDKKNAHKRTAAEVALDEQRGETFLWGELEGEESLSRIGSIFRARASDYPEYFHNGAYTTIGLKIYPTQSSSDLVFCAQIVKQVEEVIRKEIEKTLGPIQEGGVITRVDLGGSYRHVLQQSKKIKGDMLYSTVSSFVLLALVLIIAFRSIRAFFCVITPLVMGTVWTMGLMTVFVGYLNLITAFIFAVLLGLGIDFGIHFYGRYREERAAGHDDLEAMIRTHQSCGHASLLASSTTAAAFLALTLADFRGLSQFGGVAALGVINCLISVIIVLPALAFAWSRWIPLNLLGYRVDRSEEGEITSSKPFPLKGRAASLGLCIGIIGICLIPWVQVELNFNKLGAHPKPPPKDLKKGKLSYQQIQYGTTKATSPTVAFASSPEESRLIYDQLDTLSRDSKSRVSSVQSLFSLIPTEQEERIRWVKKLCRKLKRKVKLFEGDPRAGAEELLTHCKPSVFGIKDLPPWVKEKFTDRSGKLGEFIFISPRGSTSDGVVALAFHAEMQEIKTLNGKGPMVAGKTMIWAEVLTAMERDGVLSFSVALLIVLLLLFAFERSLIGLIFVSAPLLLGLGLTIGIMAIWGIKINFFNMLALPTLIGMGVDDGVHMYHRYKEMGPGSARYIVKTTGVAATLTTLTTSIGFASLILADHRGLNSLGSLSVIGMSAALFATLVILPAIFTWWDERKVRPQ